MPRYTIDTIAPTVSRTQAANALTALSDSDLIARITANMIPGSEISAGPIITELAWDPQEPEHDQLADELRRLLLQDLGVAYLGNTEDWCDDRLAQGHSSQTGRPTLSVLFDSTADITTYQFANPVVRLRAAGICNPAPLVADESIAAMRTILRNADAITGPTTVNWSSFTTADDSWSATADDSWSDTTNAYGRFP